MLKFLKVLRIAAVILGCIIISKYLIIKPVVTAVISGIIGAPVTMDGFSLNIMSSTIHMSEFKMYNPPGFPKDIMASCSKIKVIYDRATLFNKKRHFLFVGVELSELRPVKNKEGKMNVDSLKIVQQIKLSEPIPMQIDLLTLGIGKIIDTDYTTGAKPSVRNYDVNRHQSYKGITTVQQLVLIVLSAPRRAAEIKIIETFGVDLLKSVTALPVALAETVIGKDSVQQIVDSSFEDVYKISLEVVKRMGTITEQDASKGEIKANSYGAHVALMLKQGADNKTDIKISARKYIYPKLDIAAMILYQIVDALHGR